MPRKGTKGVSASLIPSPQQEEEHKRVLKPENTRTKQPRAAEPPPIRKGRQGRQKGAKNLKPREIKTKPKKSKEEISRIRSEAQKKRWTKMTPEQRKAATGKMQEGRKRSQEARKQSQATVTQDPSQLNPEQLQDACIEMVKYISQLKWEQQSYGSQGFIINWDSNDTYDEMASKVRDIEANVREMNYKQVSKFYDECKRIADTFVYQYPEAMMKSNYHYDDMGLTNHAVYSAIENINKLEAYSFRCLQITDDMSEEDIQEEVMAIEYDKSNSPLYGKNISDAYGDFWGDEDY